MEVGILAGAVSFVASLIAVGLSAGVQLGKIAQLEARTCEDRTSNKEKFLELYNSRNNQEAEIIEQGANVTFICKRLDTIEESIKGLDTKIDTLLRRRGT